MMRCSRCGTAGAAERTFCESCGAFLAWGDAPASSGGPRTVPAVTPGVAEPPTVTPAAVTPADQSPDPQPLESPAPEPREPASVVEPEPTATTAPAARPTSSLPPSTPHQSAPTVVAVRCAHCNAANPPERMMCIRCGSPLLTVEQPVPAGADGGLFPHTWGEHLVLGADHSLLKRAVGATLLVATTMLILAVTIGPWRDPFWGWTRDKLAEVKLLAERRPTPVVPQSARASSTQSGLQPRLAIDGFINTYWAQNSRGDGVGESLTVRFEEGSDIGEIQVATGIQDDITPFRSQPRPRDIRILFRNGSDHVFTQPDSPGFHEHKFSAEKVTRVTFEILSVYPADDGGSGRNHTAIAEIEFYSPP
jgi:hypothetical protein